MIKIGLTGSIGMGKTTTAKLFADAGIPVFDADVIVHQLYSKNGDAVRLIAKLFPNVVINAQVDRAALARHLAKHPTDFDKLEKTIHPLVAEKRKIWIKSQQETNQPVILFDIPLLLESAGERSVDLVIVVTVKPEEQRRRVLAREGMSEEKFEQILQRQMPDEVKKEYADYIITTDNGVADARLQVAAILKHLSAK